MDTEQLKIILQALNGLGVDAKYTVITYFLCLLAQHVFSGTCVLIGLSMVVRIVRRIVGTVMIGDRLMKAAGCSTGSNGWYPSDVRKVQDYLADGFGTEGKDK